MLLDLVRKALKRRVLNPLGLKLEYDDLAKVKRDQKVLVNLAEHSESSILVKLTVEINDPFQAILICKNEKNVLGNVNYENVMQLLNGKKRKPVII